MRLLSSRFIVSNSGLVDRARLIDNDCHIGFPLYKRTFDLKPFDNGFT